MNTNPEFSFIVPAYNEESLLPLGLQAIVDEIYRSNCIAEIIVVDDGSTDSTANVARVFEFVTVIQTPRGGLVNARTEGFLAATGELIANIDADTIIPKGWIDLVRQRFKASPSTVCISGPYIYYDLSRVSRLGIRLFYWCGYFFHIFNQHILRIGSLVQGGNFVVRKTALTQIGGYSNRFIFYGEDTDIARRLISAGTVNFSFALWAWSSGRRLYAEGIFQVGLRYALNFFWATLFKKPFTVTWKDHR